MGRRLALVQGVGDVSRMRKLLFVLVGLAAVVSGPAAMLLSDDVRLGEHWYSANRDSAGLAPEPASTPEAVVQIYAARAFDWRGLFAVHTWIATKLAGASQYEVHEVTGWGQRALHSGPGLPDRNWFGATPHVLLDLRGQAASQAISEIDAALVDYPFAETYRAWPGPNSNTFVAWMIRRLPALNVALPAHSLGKDYLHDRIVAATPSGTGYQASWRGAIGITAAWAEGIEFNLLGLVWGLDVTGPAIKWPGVGRIGFADRSRENASVP